MIWEKAKSLCLCVYVDHGQDKGNPKRSNVTAKLNTKARHDIIFSFC